MPNNVSKEYLSWRNEISFEYPGYNNGRIIITEIDNPANSSVINFLVAPTELNVSKNNMKSEMPSIGGVVIQQFGSTPEELNIGGFLLDVKQLQEAPEFIFNFKKAMTSSPSYSHEYTYSFKQFLEVEGIRYEGRVSALQYSKSGVNPFLYNFRLSFVALNSVILREVSFSNDKIKGFIDRNTGTPSSEDGEENMERKIIEKKGFVF